MKPWLSLLLATLHALSSNAAEAPPGVGRLDAALAGGTSSGNLVIGQHAGSNRLVYRLVPSQTGTLFDVWIETRARSGPACSPAMADADPAESASYSGGDPNEWLWEVRFHPVRADGTFDAATDLVAAQRFNPYTQRRNSSFEVAGDYRLAALKIPCGSDGFAVKAGSPFAMTIAPVNTNPVKDYASANELYTSDGLEGAQARNELTATARDVPYGLDPRTGLGGATPDGTEQWYPGNNFNRAPFAKHLPVYVLVYADGTREGQEYFSAAAQSSPTLPGTVYTQTFRPPADAVFTHLRGIFSAGDSFPVTLAVNGVDRATTLLSSSGAAPNRVSYGPLSAPVQVTKNDTVSIRFTCHVRNAVVRLYSNSAFDLLMGHGRGYFVALEGDENKAMPICPVPWTFPRLIQGPTPPAHR